MISRLRLVLASATLLAGCAPAATAEPAAQARPVASLPAAELARRLDAFLAQAADSGFAGSVLVARGDSIILHRGYGWADARRTQRVAAETPFWIASISKQFTAAAVLKLAEEGRLSLADSISRFFPDAPAEKRAVTLHHLLTHTGGLVQHYAADGIPDRGAAVRAVLARPPASAPGAGFRYSNDAYNLLAAVVEVAAGEPFEAYLRKRLLAPAGLERTGFWGPDEHPEVAPIPGEIPAANRRPNWGFRGATGMFSTTGDLHRWHRALEAGRVLSGESWRRMTAPHVGLRDDAVGYGWFTSRTPRGTRSVWTRGTESFGHNAILVSYPEERMVIVAASNAGGRGGVSRSRALAEELARLLFAPPTAP